MKLNLKSRKPERLMGHHDGFELIVSLEWQSVVVSMR